MTEARTIYAVEKGCYSDYHIVGLFLDKDMAKKCMELINGETDHGIDDASIKVYVDGEWLRMGQKLRTVYHSAINLGAGEDLQWWTTQELALETARVPKDGASDVEDEEFMWVRIKEANAQGNSFVSSEHAHKLAVEARQRWLVEKAEAG